jgi:NhaA family Na+:H+ antiporter
VHATVAGILVAMLVPVRARIEPARFLEAAQARLDELRQASLTHTSMIEDRTQLDAIDDIHEASGAMRPAGLVFEEYLHPTQAFIILPLFALFNAGVRIEGNVLEVLADPVSLGVIAGLVLGKQVGITAFSWLAVRLGYAALPEGVTWSQIYGVACLAGVGFTMSLFISELAFAVPEVVATAKVGILAASVLAAVWGYGFLSMHLPAAQQVDAGASAGASK